MLKYKRILLKLSGEALAGNQKFGISSDVLDNFARQLKEVHDLGVELAIVIGGGNIFRGIAGQEQGFDRATGDTLGILATIMNAIALQNSIEKMGVPTRVLTAVQMPEIAEPYIRRRAIRHLEKGRIIILAGGTGNPYFTTDSGGALRALEIGADILAKGTKVNGVYDKDPQKFADAVKYDNISFDETLTKNLKVMDAAALSLCRENDLPVIVFNILEDGNVKRMVNGEEIGTIVKN
ncbi:Uridylate kinase [Sebaldella termitidis]|uniref:Uridylate kinase n=1 Tax=Sebaldella termitidis (strain ATCC 33386 / NCTC 11300) TaxID=526218 RepID=D1AJQ6_SEBTE|nr:UMP kinase [Sebaldella termitidis]ACZ06963.1 uridylate kinase [Sebaldella termitidis ATCC 33386]MBP7979972.1 UMP kinase [Sebaldella sp.]SUI22253.1 Uridylate kinase [Sebaldella termitidis]